MKFEFESLLATSDSLAGDTGYSVVVIQSKVAAVRRFFSVASSSFTPATVASCSPLTIK